MTISKSFLIAVICICIIPFSGIAQNVFPTPSGNVGIGTTSPDAPLTVVTTAIDMAAFRNTTAANTRIVVSNTAAQVNLGIGAATPHPYLWSNSNKFYIGSDGSPSLFIDGMSNGNVGIGTIAPWTPLTVVSSSNNLLAYFQSTNANNSAITVANATGSMNIGIGSANPNP